MIISAISFSHAESSLQSRGLFLLNSFLGFKKIYSMRDFDIPLCFSNKPDGQVPAGVLEFDQVLADSDALVLAIAEAGGHYCASFKNIVDWLITKNRFNSQLGAGYSTSGKPTYVFTFTPTYADSGGRHFAMTKSLLSEKLGADVRQMYVVNRCWESLTPGNADLLRVQGEAIQSDLLALSVGTLAKRPPASKLAYNVEKWVMEYENWDRQWKEF